MATPQGYVFNVDFYGNVTPQPTLQNPGSPPGDTAPSGDWQIVVTAIPANVSQSTVANLILANAVIGFPFGTKRFQATYAALNAGQVKLTNGF